MDRFTRGFIAAIPGWLLMNIWSYIAYQLNFSELRYVDWASVMIFGNLPLNHLEGIVALFIHLIFMGFLGVIFTFLVPEITSKHLWLKGIVFSIVVGFAIHAIPILFKTPHLIRTSLTTTITDYLGGIIWALTFAYSLKWINNRYVEN